MPFSTRVRCSLIRLIKKWNDSSGRTLCFHWIIKRFLRLQRAWNIYPLNFYSIKCLLKLKINVYASFTNLLPIVQAAAAAAAGLGLASLGPRTTAARGFPGSKWSTRTKTWLSDVGCRDVGDPSTVTKRNAWAALPVI